MHRRQRICFHFVSSLFTLMTAFFEDFQFHAFPFVTCVCTHKHTQKWAHTHPCTFEEGQGRPQVPWPLTIHFVLLRSLIACELSLPVRLAGQWSPVFIPRLGLQALLWKSLPWWDRNSFCPNSKPKYYSAQVHPGEPESLLSLHAEHGKGVTGGVWVTPQSSCT